MKRLLYLLLVFTILSCGTRKQVIHPSTTDSVRVEYRTVEKEVVRMDTVTVQVPVQVFQTIKQDSSTLETLVAISTAKILPSGLLFHDMHNKESTLKAQVIVKDNYIYKDRDVYRDRNVLKEVNVKVPLRKWQKVLIVLGILLIVLVLIRAAMYARKILL